MIHRNVGSVFKRKQKWVVSQFDYGGRGVCATPSIEMQRPAPFNVSVKTKLVN